MWPEQRMSAMNFAIAWPKPLRWLRLADIDAGGQHRLAVRQLP
jgi:hypothetical protein